MRIEFVYDYGQVYLHDAAWETAGGHDEYLDALADAQRRGLSVGLAGGFVDLLMACQLWPAVGDVVVVERKHFPR